MLGRPAARADLAAGLQLPGRNSQNSNYARQFSLGFSYPYRGPAVHVGVGLQGSRGGRAGAHLRLSWTYRLDKFSQRPITLGCSTFDLTENGTSSGTVYSIQYDTVRYVR